MLLSSGHEAYGAVNMVNTNGVVWQAPERRGLVEFHALSSETSDNDVCVNANQSNFSSARWFNEMGEPSSHHEVLLSMLGLSI